MLESFDKKILSLIQSIQLSTVDDMNDERPLDGHTSSNPSTASTKALIPARISS
jgi:hypothetical protein